MKLSILASEKRAKTFIEIHPICRTEKQNWQALVRNLRKKFYIHFVRVGIPNPVNKITGCSVDTGACFLSGVDGYLFCVTKPNIEKIHIFTQNVICISYYPCNEQRSFP